MSRTLLIDRVHHCSSGGAPTGKSLSPCVFPDNQLTGMHIAKYRMHRKRYCAAMYGEANNTKIFCMSMLSRLLPGILRESSKNSMLTSKVMQIASKASKIMSYIEPHTRSTWYSTYPGCLSIIHSMNNPPKHFG